MGTRSTEGFIAALRKLLREIRIESGLTQVEFGQRSGNQHQSLIARLESGASSNVGICSLYEIAKGTKYKLWEIIKKAEGDVGGDIRNDEWSAINREVELLSSRKRKWLSKIVQDILTDN